MADIEKFVTETGRRAEKHIDIDGNGNKIISIFAEEERPLKLEKRVKQVFKPMMVEEHIETIKDGQVIDRKVNTAEPKVNLELREHIEVVKNSMIGNDNYVTKNDVAELVAQGVVAGLQQMDSKPINTSQALHPDNPFRVQSLVEQRVETKATMSTGDMITYGVLGLAIIGQIAFGVWYIFFN